MMEDFNDVVSDVLGHINNIVIKKDIDMESILSLFYMKEHLKEMNLSAENLFLLKRAINHMKNNLVPEVTNDLRFLTLWYLLNVINEPEHQDFYEKDFFSIYSKMYNFANNFQNVELITLLFPQERLIDYIKGLEGYILDESFWTMNYLYQKILIYKFFYFTIIKYDRNKEVFIYMYEILLKVYEKAMLREDIEMVLYLHMPIQFSWNGVATTYEENKIFNDNIERKLEKFTKDVIIPKYDLKPTKREINPNKKIKVAFLQERIMKYSINQVYINLLKSLKDFNSDKYEFITYDLNFKELGGSNEKSLKELNDLGFKYVDCHSLIDEPSPFYPIMEKIVKIKKKIEDDEIDILIGLHSRPEYNVLFTSRTAPKQYFWSHRNFAFDIEGVDKKITHCTGSEEYGFKNFGILNNYGNEEELSYINNAKKIRAEFPNDVIILGSIGRLIKMDNEDYLNTVFQIMKKNLKTIYLACGDGDKSNIINCVKENGLEDRFYFPGFVDTKVYGRVIDIYLNTFPDPGGESVNEFRTFGENKFVVSLRD